MIILAKLRLKPPRIRLRIAADLRYEREATDRPRLRQIPKRTAGTCLIRHDPGFGRCLGERGRNGREGPDARDRATGAFGDPGFVARRLPCPERSRRAPPGGRRPCPSVVPRRQVGSDSTLSTAPVDAPIKSSLTPLALGRHPGESRGPAWIPACAGMTDAMSGYANSPTRSRGWSRYHSSPRNDAGSMRTNPKP